MRPERLLLLREWLEIASQWRFDPVQAHCAHFILGALEATTGEPAAGILARLDLALPDSDVGVKRVLINRGGMRGIAESYFGCPARIDILNACEGDIVVLDGDEGETLGLVEGGGVLCVTSTTGLGRFPLSAAKGFWRLGGVG